MATKEVYNNSPLGALINGAQTPTATTLTVTSTSGLPTTGQYRVIVGSEIMLVNAGATTGTTLAVTRGQEGTTAAAIADGTYVVPVLTAAAMEGLCRQSLNGTNVTARREINFLPVGLTVSIADNSTTDAADITITAASGTDAAFTTPTLSNFAWVNQGSATATQNTNSISLTDTTPTSGGDNHRMLLVALPSAPFTVTAYLVPLLPGNNYFFAGLVLQESGTGKLKRFGIAGASSTVPQVSIDAYASPTTYTSNTYTMYVGNQPRWYRLHDDGTNRSYWVSGDGYNWLKLYSEARATGFASSPDHVGIAVNSQNSGVYTASVSLGSWVVANS